MKIMIDRHGLKNALGRAAGAVGSKRSTLPILGYFLLKTSAAGTLEIRATDLSTATRTFCPVAEEERPGAIAVSAAKVQEVIAALPLDVAELELLDGFQLEIRSGDFVSRIPGLDPSEFPHLDWPEGEPDLLIEAEDLQGLVRATGQAVCRDELKYSLCGINLRLQDGILVACAVDGHRLALAGKKLEIGGVFSSENGVTIPRKGLEEIKKFSPGALSVWSRGDGLYFSQGETASFVRLVDGVFPEYRRVIPQGYTDHATVKRETLLLALERVRFFAEKNKVELAIGGGFMTVRAKSAAGEASDQVAAGIQGGEVALSLNAKYLIEGLGSLEESAEVVIKYQDPTSPLLVIPASFGGFDERLLVIMGMRI